MTLNPEELERITVLTLAHYNRRADAFWEGTRDHDVSQNIAALLQRMRSVATKFPRAGGPRCRTPGTGSARLFAARVRRVRRLPASSLRLAEGPRAPRSVHGTFRRRNARPIVAGSAFPGRGNAYGACSREAAHNASMSANRQRDPRNAGSQSAPPAHSAQPVGTSRERRPCGAVLERPDLAGNVSTRTRQEADI